MRCLLLSVLLFSTHTACAGSYYTCTDEQGKKSFQTMPCKNASSSARVEYSVKTPPSAEPKRYSIEGNELAQDLIRSNRKRQLDRDIKKSENKISRYEQALEKELVALRKKKARAANNLAGAQWKTSISNEMSAVSDKYKTLITTEQSRLDLMRKENEAL